MTPKWYSIIYFHPKYTVPYITSLYLEEAELQDYLKWMLDDGYRVVKSMETDELVSKIKDL